MKFAVVLCALVACAAAIPQERGFIMDEVHSVVNSAINKAHNDVEDLKTDIKAFTSKFDGKVSNIVSSAKNEIASLTSQAANTIVDVIAKGGSAAVCAQRVYTELNTFSFSRNAENCVVSIAKFEAQVLSDIVELTSAIAELVEIVEECSSNILQAVVCAVTKVGTVEALMVEVVTSVKGAILIAEGKSVITLADVQSCATKVVGEAKTEFNKISSTVKTCA